MNNQGSLHVINIGTSARIATDQIQARASMLTRPAPAFVAAYLLKRKQRHKLITVKVRDWGFPYLPVVFFFC